MQRQWTPLLGVVFVVLIVLRLFVIGAGVPDASASGEDVLSYYEENELREVAASLTAVVAAAVLVFFAVHLRRVLRPAAPDDYLPDAVFAGGILVAAALGLAEGLHGALAVDPEYLTPEAAKALHVLDQQLIFPTMLGFGVLLLALGLAIVRLRVLPTWLGWAALVLAVACFTPAALFAIVLGLAWLVALSVALYLKGPSRDGVTLPAR